ncbi:MAG: hypothetical protein ACREQY_04605, partial [Candidatus Binatia bacterium]
LQESPPEDGGVGGLFGLFGRGAKKDEKEARPPEEAPVAAPPAEAPSPAVRAEEPPPVESVEPPAAAQEIAPAPAPDEAAVKEPRPESVPSPAVSATEPPPPPLESDLEASRRPQADPEGLELPEQEIRGELEKPDIFFLLPKARNRSDEHLIRARIRREITRPLIKDWLEEELLLK